MKKGIIFDFDGVIINSHNVQVNSLKTAYRAVVGDGDIPYEAFFKLSGDSLENIFSKLGLPEDMVEIYRDSSRRDMDLIQVHEGILELLKDIRKKDYICVLCTGKERSRTQDILKKFNMEHYFNLVICSDDIQCPKPNPESINIVMHEFHLSKEQLIMIGDGINDVKCAYNAGIASVGVSWGDLPQEELLKAKPSKFVYSIEELRRTLYNWLIK